MLYVVFIFTAPRVFTGYRIYMSFFQTVPPMLVLAIGLTFIITAGEIDLSFPAVVALSGFVFTWVFKNFHAPWIGFILALASGALVGYINGLLVARLRVPSIMATLAAQFFWYGVTILIAGGLQIDIQASPPRRSIRSSSAACSGSFPVQALWALGARGVLLVHPQPAQVRRGDHVHRRQRRGRAGDGDQRRDHADQSSSPCTA